MDIDTAVHSNRPAPSQSASVVSSTSVVTTAPRERLTVDLRGLADALKAHSKARQLTVSETARLAIAAALETVAPCPENERPVEEEPLAEQRIKLTVRLRRGPAVRLAERARASGLSLGSYLAALIDGLPARPLAAVSALNASTDQLAVVAGDLNHVIRLRRDQSTPPGEQVDQATRRIVEDLRRHLELAARLVAELRPARTPSNQRLTGVVSRRVGQ